MKRRRIADNPGIKTSVDLARSFLWFRRVAPFLNPLFRRLGADVSKLDEVFDDLDDLVRQSKELASVPDEFNDLLGPSGWIVYDRIDVEVAKTAIALAKSEGSKRAEDFLVEHFSPETVAWGLKSMHAVEAFRPRMELAGRALEDYTAERYHACVPVVLALLDGMVNDVHQKALGSRRGISAKDVDLEAWNTFAGHSTGLMRLVEIFRTGRRKTNTEPLRLPYRNGIMHGIDLGYGTKIVAAKCWAALFAAREWALKAERKQLHAPPSSPKRTFKEKISELRATVAQHERMEAHKRWREQWQPRVPFTPTLSPAGGSDPDAETPEHALCEYLEFWRAGNYGKMAGLVATFQGDMAKAGPVKIREVFRSRKLDFFAVRLVRDEAPARTEIVVDIEQVDHSGKGIKTFMASMMFTASDGRPALLHYEPGKWCVVNWTLEM